MRLEERELKVFDEMSKITLKAPLSTNKTFKIMINMLDHKLWRHLYVKGSSEEDRVIICLYMDDLLVMGSNEDELEKLKVSMENEFEMSDLGHLAYFLEMEIVNTNHGAFMHHKKYA